MAGDTATPGSGAAGRGGLAGLPGPVLRPYAAAALSLKLWGHGNAT